MQIRTGKNTMGWENTKEVHIEKQIVYFTCFIETIGKTNEEVPSYKLLHGLKSKEELIFEVDCTYRGRNC